MGVRDSKGKLNFAEDAMVYTVDKINTSGTAVTSSRDD